MTDAQLFWECCSLTACEIYPEGVPPNLIPPQISKDLRYSTFHSLNSCHNAEEWSSEKPDKSDLLKLWKEIVETFTQCNLTVKTDKLIAISGIAKAMQLKLDDEYCAGLWREHLITQLYWDVRSGGRELHPRPEPYRAPSWSWACLDGPISLSTRDKRDSAMETLIDIIDCDIENANSDATSIVTSGRLRLSGWLSTMRVCPADQNEWSVFFNGVWSGNKNGVMVQIDSQLPCDQLHCLPLFVNTHLPFFEEDDRQTPYWNVACLILCSTGDAKGRFRRLGTFHMFTGAFGIEDWKVFEKLQKEAWFEYEAIGSEAKYIMSIV
jgi:hypothetical protein